MWQNMNLNPSVAAGPRIVETRRQQLMDHGVPARAPGAIGGVEARRTEGATCGSEARCVERQPRAACRRRARDERGRTTGIPRRPLAARGRCRTRRRCWYGALWLSSDAIGKRQPDGPAMQALQQPTMAVQERAELSPRGIGDDVDEDHVVAAIRARSGASRESDRTVRAPP